MKKLRVIIADDEAPARDELKHILSRIEGVSLAGEAKNGLETLKLIKKVKPDVVFLDIEMPGKNGIEVARDLIKREEAPYMIFATAYDNYAVAAFEVNAVDYILKPFDGNRVRKSIQKAVKYAGSEFKGEFVDKLQGMIANLDDGSKYISKIPVKHKGKVNLIDVGDVVYARGEGGLVFIYEDSKEYLTDFSSLDSLKENLNPSKFYRTHRSYIVNLDTMKEIVPLGSGHYTVKCRAQAGSFVEIPLSRRQAKELKKKFKF